jgi:basic amino acid/polyamine antiporter, APA family
MPGREQSHLVRAIGRWSLTALMVNLIIGSGIFGLPLIITRLVGAASVWAFLFAAAATAITMACFAEVSSRFTASGGVYLYTRTAFGPMTGIVMAWFGCLVRLTAAASNANLFVIYLAEFWPGCRRPLPRFLVLTALIGALAMVNYRGVRSGTRLSNFFTIAKLTPLGIFIVAGVVYIVGRHQSVALAAPAGPFGPWLQAVLLLMFTYGGFEAGLMPGGETKDPRRDSSFALFTALAIVTLIYVPIQIVVMAALPGSLHTERPLAAAAHIFIGDRGATLITLTILLSVYGVLTANILAVPRLMFAMAERGDFPAVLSRVHARFHTPHMAICTFAVLLWLFSLRGSFEWNLTLSAVARLVYYGSVSLALPVLRRRGPPAAFHLPLGNLFAALGVGLSLILLTRVDRSGMIALVLVTVLALGNGWWARRRGSRAGAGQAVAVD